MLLATAKMRDAPSTLIFLYPPLSPSWEATRCCARSIVCRKQELVAVSLPDSLLIVELGQEVNDDTATSNLQSPCEIEAFRRLRSGLPSAEWSNIFYKHKARIAEQQGSRAKMKQSLTKYKTLNFCVLLFEAAFIVP